MTFEVKNTPQKNCNIFLGAFIWNHPNQKLKKNQKILYMCCFFESVVVVVLLPSASSS